MADYTNFKSKLYYRAHEDPDKYWIEDFWKEEIILFTNDINKTIDFINTQSTDEEFYWLSEIFEDIAQKTQNKDFIFAIKARFLTLNNQDYISSIENDIMYAEGAIED